VRCGSRGNVCSDVGGLMAKDKYAVLQIPKSKCSALLDKYHYLSTISRGFKSGENFGLMVDEDVKGVCIFTKWPVPELLVGCFAKFLCCGQRVRHQFISPGEISRCVLAI
jgi:hypothetical protein